MNDKHPYLDTVLDKRDPDPWLALYLDQSLPLSETTKVAWLNNCRSNCRQFFLPIVRPLARFTVVVFQLVKIAMPSAFTSSKVLHRILSWGLRTWVSKDANLLILRHFHIGSEILAFIATNVEGVNVPLNPLKPANLEDVKNDLFLIHDLNLYNFIIELNSQLRTAGETFKPKKEINFKDIADGEFPIDPLPDRWTNFLDIESAIELFTPIYQLFLTDNDFWRASNSLQLDETIGIYISTLLRNPWNLALVNNKHPLVPLSTLEAGHRLVLHGLSSEILHAMLVEYKTGRRVVA